MKQEVGKEQHESICINSACQIFDFIESYKLICIGASHLFSCQHGLCLRHSYEWWTSRTRIKQ